MSERDLEHLASSTSFQGGTLLTFVREVLGSHLEHDTHCPDCFFVSLGLSWQLVYLEVTHEYFFHTVRGSSTVIALFDPVSLLWSYCIISVTRLTAFKVTNWNKACQMLGRGYACH